MYLKRLKTIGNQCGRYSQNGYGRRVVSLYMSNSTEKEQHSCQVSRFRLESHGFAVSLTVLAMKSRSHADHVISHAFQL